MAFTMHPNYGSLLVDASSFWRRIRLMVGSRFTSRLKIALEFCSCGLERRRPNAVWNVGAGLPRPIDIKLSLPHRLLAFGPDQRSAQQELGGVGRLLACIQATA